MNDGQFGERRTDSCQTAARQSTNGIDRRKKARIVADAGFARTRQNYALIAGWFFTCLKYLLLATACLTASRAMLVR
ncbi:hypothetical protein [Massilia sp. TSP1-1-2]|uniref:hypothetical protein n=1 Tax=unclassified Massilia TaxID=2609279 RepID=UPI003CF49903